MKANPRGYRSLWIAALAACFAFSSALASTPLDGPRKAPLPEDAEGQIESLDYHVISRHGLPRKKKVPADPTLKQQMDALDLEKSKKDFEEVKKPKPAPKLDLSHWVPSWMGTTGGLDMPWAYTMPKGTWAASLIAKNRSADSRYWPLVYNRIDGADRGLTVSYGIFDGIEVTADVDRQDRSFTYASQRSAEFGSNTFLTPASFHGDRALVGLGAKFSRASEDLQFALGFHTTDFDNIDRNVIEFHDYDRMNNLYAVASVKRGRKLAGHFQVKYVTYDWAGSVFPSGATTNVAGPAGIFVDPTSPPRRGFAPGEDDRGYPVFQPVDPRGTGSDPLVQDPPAGLQVRQVGKGTRDWVNFGFGLDFEPSENFRLIGEINWESGIEFVSDLTGSELDNWFVNVGARYTRANWAGTFGMRHVNTRAYREPVLSVAYRF